MDNNKQLIILTIGIVFVFSIIKNSIFDPAVLALLIPIVAIVSFSPIGRAIAGNINKSVTNSNNREIDELKNQFKSLENKVAEYEQEISSLRESVIFYEGNKKLIDTEKEQKKINLEKIQEKNL